MYKYILQGAGEINWMALFALITFVMIFFISIVMIFGRSQTYIDKMSQLPLDDEFITKNEKKINNE